MKTATRITAAIAACLAVSQANAGAVDETAKARFAGGISSVVEGLTDKAASTRSLGSRATGSTSLTVYGGFELQTSANVYILVRGNSLGTLGVTQGYLDRPRFRIYNAALSQQQLALSFDLGPDAPSGFPAAAASSGAADTGSTPSNAPARRSKTGNLRPT